MALQNDFTNVTQFDLKLLRLAPSTFVWQLICSPPNSSPVDNNIMSCGVVVIIDACFINSSNRTDTRMIDVLVRSISPATDLTRTQITSELHCFSMPFTLQIASFIHCELLHFDSFYELGAVCFLSKQQINCIIPRIFVNMMYSGDPREYCMGS